MTWIRTISYQQSTGRLRELYDRIKGPGDVIDNIMMAHSLRPHTMEGHMALYKHVLHNSANKTPKWILETIGVWVSLLNGCDYCAEHHFAGLKRLMRDDERADRLLSSLKSGNLAQAPLDEAQKAALVYARALTQTPGRLTLDAVAALREAGFDDGAILEINQVTAYFAYANRTVLGLGCNTDGDILGLSPGNSDDPDDWGHG
ncbi:MAG: peroxidase-related enzyme [Nitratireductor sp.]|nr:peroxidase-related enzyme [Nitratireductor sp.]MCB1456229.1 peroxidase-related enzyme [Nitratireductor sp.]